MQLHGFGIVDSPLCSFCAQSIKTILHLFCFCPVVDQFWYEVFSWICCHFKRDIDFCNFNKILGFQELENCTQTDLINCFLLNARFLIDRPAVSSVAKRTLSVREVWGSIPGPVKSTQCRQRLATVATFLRSCVAQALSRGNGPRNSLHASA